MGNSQTNGTGFEISIKLFVVGSLPFMPVGEFHEILESERQKGFLFLHCVIIHWLVQLRPGANLGSIFDLIFEIRCGGPIGEGTG